MIQMRMGEYGSTQLTAVIVKRLVIEMVNVRPLEHPQIDKNGLAGAGGEYIA